MNFPSTVYFSSDGNVLHYVRFLDSTGTSVEDNIVAVEVGGDIFSTVFTVGSDGFARIVYTSTGDGADSLFIKICTNADGTEGISIQLDTSISLYEFSIVLDDSDNVYIVYNDYNSNNIKLARCDADGTNLQISTITEFTYGSTFGFALASDGFLRILYADRSPTSPNTALYYLKCTSADGTAFSKNQVTVSGLSEPYYMDMVLANDDTARIIYADTTNGSATPGINYIKCLNDAGSSTAVAVIDSNHASNSGQVSIVLNSEGLPRIAYAVISDAGFPEGGYDISYAIFTVDDTSSYTTHVAENVPVPQDGNYVSICIGEDDVIGVGYLTNGGDSFRFARIVDPDTVTYTTFLTPDPVMSFDDTNQKWIFQGIMTPSAAGFYYGDNNVIHES